MAKKEVKSGFSFDDFIKENGFPSLEVLEKQQQSYKCYSTGSFMLDLAIGEKDCDTGLPGIPERAIVEMFGINQSCKTATAEALMKNVLDADPSNRVVCVFAEEPDVDRMLRVGIDKTRVFPLYSYEKDGTGVKEGTAETHLETVKLMVQDPAVKLVVIDSVKALCSVHQVFKDGKAIDMSNGMREALAARANMMTRFLLNFKQYNKRAILFMTNQISDRIATSPFDHLQNPIFNVQTPGGRGMEYEATIRIRNESRPIWTKNKHALTEEKLLKGWEIAYKIIKNKYSKKTAYRIAYSDFLFDPPGFRRSKEILSCAIYLGLASRTVNGIFTLGTKKVQGEENCLRYLDENPKVRMELEAAVIAKADEVYAIDDSAAPVVEMPSIDDMLA